MVMAETISHENSVYGCGDHNSLAKHSLYTQTSSRSSVQSWVKGSISCFFLFISQHTSLNSTASTVKSLYSAVLFLPPVVKAWLKLISASLFSAPGLCFCWVFSVFSYFHVSLQYLSKHDVSISTISSPRFAFQKLSASLFLAPSSF